MKATPCKKHPTKIRHETKEQALEHIRQLEARGWGNPDYNAYQAKTERQIPVFVLQPIAD